MAGVHHTNYVEVHVLQARNLMAADSNGKSDPYCTVAVGKKTQRTKVVKKTLSPVWNHAMKFEVANPKVEKVVIHVLDKDRFSSDAIGEIAVTLDDLPMGQMRRAWYTLDKVPRGEVEIGLLAVNFGNKGAPQSAGAAAGTPPAQSAQKGGSQEVLQGHPPPAYESPHSGSGVGQMPAAPQHQPQVPAGTQAVLHAVPIQQQQQQQPQQPQQQQQQSMLQQQMQQPVAGLQQQQPAAYQSPGGPYAPSSYQQPAYPYAQQPAFYNQPQPQHTAGQQGQTPQYRVPSPYAPVTFYQANPYGQPMQQQVQVPMQPMQTQAMQQPMMQQAMQPQAMHGMPLQHMPVQMMTGQVMQQPMQPMQQQQQQPMQPMQPVLQAQPMPPTGSTQVRLSQSALAQGFNLQYNELRFEKKIGVGGFGEVWKGEWAGTSVAIKKILKADISEGDLAEFSKEIMLMSKLRHPNIVQFLGACLQPEFCLLTEYMDRGSLFHVLADESQQLSWSRKVAMSQDICKGMLYLHTRNPPIVHRDIKSLNVLVTQEWKCTIGDFGLTRIKDNQAMSTRCGSPAWSAPEVLRGEVYDEKADVFSFGVVLWEIITRQPPYKGMNPNQLIGQGLRPPIPQCPVAGLVELMVRCWDNNPRVRPTFAGILDELKLVQVPPGL